MKNFLLLAAVSLVAGSCLGQAPAPAANVTQPSVQMYSGRVPPAYPMAYPPATPDEIKAVLSRVLGYLEVASPIKVIDRDTKAPVTDLTKLPPHAGFDRTDFLITSYEWGVTYAGMLLAAEVTGEARYKDYTAARLSAIATVAAHLRSQPAPAPSADAEPVGPQRMFALRAVLQPRSLDDSGAMCTAFIKASRAGVNPAQLRPWIDNYMQWIAAGQFRLPDGTLARNRPLANALWLDDLYMGVPALAQMGALTGEGKYFDDAVKQVLQFSSRMFVPETKLYRHGWI
jgi:hypothetical protein